MKNIIALVICTPRVSQCRGNRRYIGRVAGTLGESNDVVENLKKKEAINFAWSAAFDW